MNLSGTIPHSVLKALYSRFTFIVGWFHTNAIISYVMKYMNQYTPPFMTNHHDISND
jgi:hypothetical protein